MIKSITAKKIFEKHPEVKKQLRGGENFGQMDFCKYCKQVWQ
jgi:hypothetical protein